MSRITIGVDVGGTKTAAAVAIDGKEVSRAEGVGGAVRQQLRAGHADGG